MEKITSYADVSAKLANNSRSLMLIYKSGHRESECAYQNLDLALQDTSPISAYSVDVNSVLDIHPKYGITSVPSLLLFENAEFKDVAEGCHNNKHYKKFIAKTISATKAKAEVKPAKSVVVYSTPSCSWCNSLKTWMQQNRIVYSDIDISRDDKAAQDLIKRSGHQGVPQTDIDGQIVVGFNQPLLKELLEIQ